MSAFRALISPSRAIRTRTSVDREAIAAPSEVPLTQTPGAIVTPLSNSWECATPSSSELWNPTPSIRYTHCFRFEVTQRVLLRSALRSSGEETMESRFRFLIAILPACLAWAQARAQDTAAAKVETFRVSKETLRVELAVSGVLE